MTIDDGLASLADRYRSRGYQVVVRPGPEDLPDFAKGFRVDAVARRASGSVLAAVKKTPKELEADPDVVRYVEITEKQPGWRFDVILLSPTDSARFLSQRQAKEPTQEELRAHVEAVRRLLDANYHPQAMVAAWSYLEAIMRRRLRAEGEEAGWGTPPRTLLNRLLSSGLITTGVFRDLEELYQARNLIVHGFATPAIGPDATQFLLDTAEQLREEVAPARQPA